MKHFLLTLACILICCLNAISSVVTASWTISEGWTPGSDSGTVTLTTDGVRLSALQGTAAYPPVVNANYGDLRIYAGGSLSIQSVNGEAFTKIVFRLSAQGLRRLGTMSANTGNLSADTANGLVTWTGQSSQVTINVPGRADLGTDGASKPAQFAISSPIDILFGEEEKPDPDTVIAISKAQSLYQGTECKVRGMVYATGMSGFLIGDGTGYIYYYNPQATETFRTGDIVTISGTLGNYGGFNQFKEGAIITKIGHIYPERGKIDTLEGSAIDDWAHNPTINYVSVNGMFNMSGAYYNIAFDGATSVGSLNYSDKTLLNRLQEGKTYQIHGYAFMVTGNSRYVNIIATEIEEAGKPIGNADAMYPDIPVGAASINFSDSATSPAVGTPIGSNSYNGLDLSSSPSSVITTSASGYRSLRASSGTTLTIKSSNGNKFRSILFGLADGSELISADNQTITKYEPVWKGESNEQTFTVGRTTDIFYIIVNYSGDDDDDPESSGYKITVTLPDNNDARLKGKILVIENISTGAVRKLSITDSAQFVMSNLTDGTEVEVYLTDAQGNRISRPYNAKISGTDIAIALPQDYMPQFAAQKASITTSDNKDLTSEATFRWKGLDGTTMSENADFPDAIIGTEYILSAALTGDSSKMYTIPAETRFKAEGEATVRLKAVEIPQYYAAACIIDNATGEYIPDADISIKQAYPDGTENQQQIKSDKKGRIDKAPLKELNTQILVSKTGYADFSRSLTADEIHNAAGSDKLLDLGNIKIKPLSGTSISLDIKYKDRNGVTNDNFPEARNLIYTVTDKKTNKEIESVLQYPRLILPGLDTEGQQLEINVKSAVDAFTSQSAECVIKDGTGRASITIVERGAVEITASTQPEGRTVVMAFGPDGNQAATTNMSEGKALIHSLPSGKYKIIAMRTDDPARWIRFSLLDEAGMKDGENYISGGDATVSEGATASITLKDIPSSEESGSQYTGSASSAAFSKMETTVGNTVTVTAFIDFNKEYSGKISDLRVTACLPEGIAFKDNSVMLDGKASAYEYNPATGRLEIPVASEGGRIKFCVSAVNAGEKILSISAKFKSEGRAATAAIGTACMTARDMNITAAPTVTDQYLTVSGECQPEAEVSVYDGNNLIGKTKANALGYWNGRFTMPQAYNGSVHPIQAKVVGSDGIQITSKTIEVKIDRNSIVATKVTMTNCDHSGRDPHEQTTVFDLQNHRIDGNQYYRFWPANPDFNFTIELNDNSDGAADAVVLLVYTTKDEWKALEADYNSTIGRWTASGKFSAAELPVGVKVNILAEKPSVTDRAMLSDTDNEFDSAIADYWAARKSDAYEFVPADDTDIPEYPEEMSVEELTALVDEMEKYVTEEDVRIKDLDVIFSESLPANVEFSEGRGLRILEYTEQPEDAWIKDGYRKLDVTDGSCIFIRTLDRTVDVVDTGERVHWQYDIESAAINGFDKAPRDGSNSNVGEVILNIINTIDKINGVFSTFKAEYEKMTNNMADLEKFWTEHAKNLSQKIPAHENLVTKQEKWIADYTARLEKETNPLKRVLLEGEISHRKDLLAKTKKLIREMKIDANTTRASLKNLRFLQGKIAKVMPFAKYIALIANGVSNLNHMVNVLRRLPQQCDCYPNELLGLQINACNYASSQVQYVFGKIAIEAVNDLTTVGALIPTGGTALPIVALKQVVKKIVVDMAIDFAAERGFKAWEHNLVRRSGELHRKCSKPCDEEEEDDDHTWFHCNCKDVYDCTCYSLTCLCKNCNELPDPQTVPIQDPSGFVYEGAESQRVEGVKATLYQKTLGKDDTGNTTENVVIWDAARYGQSNPVITDAEGYYRWDVPEGMWQVRFEKEGYETVATEWLPVPPPQLDVNIAMRHLVAPEISGASATPSAITIDFSKFMLCPSIIADRIRIRQKGILLNGKIEFADYEKNVNGEVASRIVFIPEVPVESSDVEVSVSKDVLSYAGIPMTSDYVKVIPVRQKLSSIETNTVVEVKETESREIEVHAKPSGVGAGIEISATSSMPSISTITPPVAVTDKNGIARFLIIGNREGDAEITFTEKRAGFQTTSDIHVVRKTTGRVAKPKASVPTNAPVATGTEVYLSCVTPDSHILYTTDGSDPSELSENTTVYDGNPIVITNDVCINAIALADDMSDSEMASFRYLVKGLSRIDINAVDGLPEVNISPCPLHDVMKVSASGQAILRVCVYDMRGAMLISADYKDNRADTEIDVATLQKGIYLVIIETDLGRVSTRVIKS